MSENNKPGNWSERFAVIDRYTPTDEAVCSAMNVTADELATARDLRKAGTIQVPEGINVDRFANMFSAKSIKATASAAPATVSAPVKSTKKPTVTSHTKSPTSSAPTTATKPVRELKKRGRKGTKIAEAFIAIPSTPVPVEQFATQNDVSLNVLRQSKRFDKSGTAGAVRVKKDKESGTLMIWREVESD